VNKKLYIALAALVLLIAVALIVTESNNQAQSVIGLEINRPVSQSALSQLAISNAISNKIGVGGVQYFPHKVTPTAPPLVNGTKPEILYIGAEYCPFCAITRWGLIIALMRFGTFTNLHYMASNETDVFPNTPTFDFYNSTYTSNYVSFVSVETTTRNRNIVLQTPTPSQEKIFNTFNPQGGIPFIDFANQSLQLDAPELPITLEGQTWNSTLANLTFTNSSISQALVGSADVFTAQICMITNNTPQSVCDQNYVTNIERNNLG
jgi:thiol-disulfide isomerase/thioredoxin